MRKKKDILVLVETSTLNGRNMLEGIAKFAREQDWEIEFEQRGIHDPLPSWFYQWQGSGIISRTVTQKNADLLRAKGLPTVELAGNGSSRQFDVAVDDMLLARMAFDHLRERGFHRFACYAFGHAWWAEAKLDAFVQVVRSQGFSCERITPDGRKGKKSAEWHVPQWDDSEQEKLERWLKRLPRPIGIFAVTDRHAKRVLDACHRFGISVPEEIAVLGTENDQWFCRTLDLPLSSIDVNGQRVGYEAAQMLHRMMHRKGFKPTRILIPPAFVAARRSTDAVAVEDPDIAQAMRFIRENVSRRIGVEDVVEHVGLSRRTLERRFLQSLGRSPYDDIQRVRMEWAKELLRETDLTAVAIARTVGVSSSRYLARIFAEQNGISMNKYRLIYSRRDQGRSGD